MKNAFLVVFAVMMGIILTACGSKDKDGNGDNGGVNSSVIIEKSLKDEDPLADIREKTPLTIEDLNKIDKYKFPVSYTYSIYNINGGTGGVETGEYVYPVDEDYKLLLPIYENVVSRRIVSSVMSHDRINTVIDIALENGERYSITYVNNPDTLEYISASVNTPNGTLSYVFHY